MGRIIDHAALLILCAIVLFSVLLVLFGSIPAACTLTFGCCTLMIRLRRSRFANRRMSRLEAEILLNNWALADDEETRMHISQLLGCASDDPCLHYLPRHPSASLSVGDIYGQWKANRSLDKIILASLCRADPRAKSFARTLHAPSIEIADAAKLLPLIRRSGFTPPRFPHGRMLLQRLRLTLCTLPERHSWRRSLLYGLILLPIYMLTGNAGYLFLGIGTLFLAGVTLHMNR